MAIQKKNLLEAFQASAAAEKAPSAPAPRASSKAGGPFAASAQPAPAALETPRRERWQPDQLQRLVALFVVVSVAAFFLGRASVSSVGAQDAPASAEPAPRGEASQAAIAPHGEAAPAASTQPEATATAATPAERALLDPRNRYTVKLVEYRSGRDDTLALETLRYLQGLGLPAVAQFRGRQLFILLGAAASTAELDDLLARARTLTGPPPLSKKNEFHDAYVVAIDKLIQR